ncbi:hypothetical protein J6590_062715 [Homalodisca vitripennis]|nr:hypothetical protein J6590_062715 [Homalodisca vitripennis]
MASDYSTAMLEAATGLCGTSGPARTPRDPGSQSAVAAALRYDLSLVLILRLGCLHLVSRVWSMNHISILLGGNGASPEEAVGSVKTATNSAKQFNWSGPRYRNRYLDRAGEASYRGSHDGWAGASRLATVPHPYSVL